MCTFFVISLVGSIVKGAYRFIFLELKKKKEKIIENARGEDIRVTHVASNGCLGCLAVLPASQPTNQPVINNPEIKV